ncbi:26.5 kDa heat shock protein- mitochondrial [Striga hermonthica]|uniref:26.5 kDa heat shock protein- mitochondrial n=1 Tax=Striga hermonthica TaxID=68872 RepID=A0A9N7N1N2_STRHE|nr:26.5 kDa heat shock protein- mitochondrial [Striga hermonthica]
MALARWVVKNLQQTASSPARSIPALKQRSWGSQLLRRLSSAPEEENPSAAVDVAVADGGKKSKLLRRRRSRKGGLWRRNNRDFVPALWELFPRGLVEATENMARAMENLSPWQLKEREEGYSLKYQMPGLAKEDVKIMVEDGGVLHIRGEHKEEKEEEEDEGWSSSYGYYDTSIVLPEDAKVEEIKAEMKDGVLSVVVPKRERANKDVREVQVH